MKYRLGVGGFLSSFLVAWLAHAQSTGSGNAVGWFESDEWRTVIGAREGPCVRKQPLARLRRVPGLGNAPIAERAARIVENHTRYAGLAGNRHADERSDSVRVEGTGWFIEAEKQGRFIRLHDTNMRFAPVPVEQRFSRSEILERGKELATSVLADLLPIGRGERLIPVATSYHQQAFWPDGGTPYAEVLENIAVFTREIDGLPVVGPGCRAVIFMDNEGSLTGFDIEWSRYEREPLGDETITKETVESRIGMLMQQGLVAGRRKEISRTCGYYDPGTIDGVTTEYIQPAIAIQYQVDSDGFIRTVSVPVAKSFVPAKAWPETVVLRSMQDAAGSQR